MVKLTDFDHEKFQQIISKFADDSILEKYYHGLVDSWLRRGKLKYHDYSSFVDDLDDWWTLEECFMYLSTSWVNSSGSWLDDLKKKLPKADLIFNLIGSRNQDLVNFLVTKTNNLSGTFLTDFNWTVKLATSSDKLAKLNEPLCSLRLVKSQAGSSGEPDKANNNTINQIYRTRNANESVINFEMSRGELKNLIGLLESIQNKFEIYNIESREDSSV